MNDPLTISQRSALLLAAAVAVAGVAVGGGAFFGGWVLGERMAPETAPQTELAEKTYTVEDLETALSACQLDGAEIADGSVTLIGADHPSMKRQCFIAEMGATELADREFSYGFGTREQDQLEGGDYRWSNVHMVWAQTDDGRDVTITVE